MIGAMAVFHPEPMPAWMKESAPERLVRRTLARLDDRWHVIHHLAWRRPGPGRYEQGEGDFILVHPERGVLVLEVKGGEVAHHDGIWTTTRRGGSRVEIEDPMSQADRTVRAIVKRLQAASMPAAVTVRSGVVFPSVHAGGGMSMNVPRSLIIDAFDLADPVAAIERIGEVYGMHAHLTDGEAAELVALLSPSVTTSIRLADSAAGINEIIQELTAAQAAVLDLLDLQRRATVVGGSGTGKTVLAVEKARRLAAAATGCC